MGMERVDPRTVAAQQQIQAWTYPTSRVPSVRRKSSPLSLESVNYSEMDFGETMDALTKALIESEESGRGHLTIQCGMGLLSMLENFVIALGLALKSCRPALTIDDRLESMENKIPVMEEAAGPPNTKERPPSQLPPPRLHGGACQSIGSHNGRRQVNNGWRHREHRERD